LKHFWGYLELCGHLALDLYDNVLGMLNNSQQIAAAAFTLMEVPQLKEVATKYGECL